MVANKPHTLKTARGDRRTACNTPHARLFDLPSASRGHAALWWAGLKRTSMELVRPTGSLTGAQRSSGVWDKNPEEPKRVTERRVSISARDGAQLETVLNAIANEATHNEVDPALIFAMERTYLSAMNQTFYLMLLATGLMSINDHDVVPRSFGAVVYVFAIMHAAISYVTHLRRLNALENGGTCTPRESKVWLGMLFVLAISISVLDLAYIFIYPVLARAKAVELVTPNGDSS